MSTEQEWEAYLELLAPYFPKHSFSKASQGIVEIHSPDGPKKTVNLGPWSVAPRLAASHTVHLLGKSKSHHARKLIFKKMSKPEAVEFFNAAHPFGYRKSRWHGGLYDSNFPERCLMAASFAQIRVWNRASGPYRSAELILLGTQHFEYVQGGASKLLSAYIQEKEPHEIVTRGPDHGVFETLGFTRESYSEGQIKWRKILVN